MPRAEAPGLTQIAIKVPREGLHLAGPVRERQERALGVCVRCSALWCCYSGSEESCRGSSGPIDQPASLSFLLLACLLPSS